MLRVIAGRFGGRALKAPASQTTRPVMDKVRASIFSSLGERAAAAVVLDLYAGSGALGIEALSRGAKHVDFVEKSSTAQRTIKQNLDNLSLGNLAKVCQSSVERFIGQPQKDYDLIFFDPPYRSFDERLAKQALNLLKSGGVMVVSSLAKTDITLGGQVKQRIYGDTKISYFLKE